MEKLATDIYSFAELRRNGFTYVDKTAQVLPLCDMSIGKQFFLARPRRFGKSLLVSTLHCLFEGRRELFTGLAIEPKWDWSKTWPVLHLDMGSCQAETVEELKGRMLVMLQKVAVGHGIGLRSDDPSGAFSQIDERDYAAKYDLAGKKVVKIGVSFSSEQRTIVDVKIAVLSLLLSDREKERATANCP